MPGRFAGSIFANPFSHNSSVAGIQKVATREEAVECYRKWLDGKLVIEPLEETLYRIIDSIPLLARHLDQGGKLGCWCAPQRCHGEALIEFVEATLGRKLAPAVGGGGGRE
jgi:hypothetical protein